MLWGGNMAGVPAGTISATPAELPGDRVALRHQTPVWPHHIGTFSQEPQAGSFCLKPENGPDTCEQRPATATTRTTSKEME